MKLVLIVSSFRDDGLGCKKASGVRRIVGVLTVVEWGDSAVARASVTLIFSNALRVFSTGGLGVPG